MAKTWAHKCPETLPPNLDYYCDELVCPHCGLDPVLLAETEAAYLRELEDNAEAMAQTRKIIHHLKKLEVCRETIGVLQGVELFWCLENPNLLSLRARQNICDLYLELPLALPWAAVPQAFPKGPRAHAPR